MAKDGFGNYLAVINRKGWMERSRLRMNQNDWHSGESSTGGTGICLKIAEK